MRTFIRKLKQTRPRDYFHIILFVVALIPAWILHAFRPHMWLICEYGMEARDNGYWLYKYICENHSEKDVVYAIKSNSIDYDRVSKIGKTIPFGGLIHWIYYLAAEINISTHKGGKPNAAVCYLLEIYGILKNKRVFLQHGITKDLAELFFYKNTKMRLFICGAKPEYEFVKEKFGYPEGYVVYTGFARFDELLKQKKNSKVILVSPTWRNWLYTISSDPYKNNTKDYEQSEYYKKWMSFLNSTQLQELLENTNYELVFFPHRNMTSFFKKGQMGKVRITNWEEDDLQKLMIDSSIMITDYSSSAMDYVYMEKPVIYYQFDYEQYRKGELKEGYFDYLRDGFGPVVKEEKDLLEALEALLNNQCLISEVYNKRINDFFETRDTNNCNRIYQEICKLEEQK